MSFYLTNFVGSQGKFKNDIVERIILTGKLNLVNFKNS